MRQMRLLLRLHSNGASAREISRAVGAARSTVQDAIKRAAAAGLSWPVPEDLTDAVLEEKLFARAGVGIGKRLRPEPNWAAMARELKRPGVTLQILWEEYREEHASGYGYSRFCDLFRAFEQRLSPTMRQRHEPGEKAFVDYSGKKIGIVDPGTGEIHEAEIFVSVLGASNLTYSEATWTQQLPDWIGSHVRMFRFFGGAPKLIVPDNLKSGVRKASFYDPEINRGYGKMADHYSVGILPARPYKPRDKAKVEAAVRFAQSYILGRLRDRTFFSLAEANAAIAEATKRMNDAVMRRIGVSRRQLFETIEKATLHPLPEEDFVVAEWLLARVGVDYHVEVHGFFYSVPHGLIREAVDVRVTQRTIEIFHKGRRVGAHERRHGGGAHGTDPAHMPRDHRGYASWTTDRFRSWAAATGPNTEALILAVIASRRHPPQGFRTCLGVLRHIRGQPKERVEAAAERAVAIGALSYRAIVGLLDARPGRSPTREEAPLLFHENLRKPNYFQ